MTKCAQFVLCLALAAACSHPAPKPDSHVRPAATSPGVPEHAGPHELPEVAATELTAKQLARDQALVPRVSAILDAYQNSGGALSPDGKLVVFRSDRAGSNDLYLAEVAAPERPPLKIVSGPERIGSAVFSHDGKAVVFRQDTGADENFHILRVNVDGSGRTDLTPSEKRWRDHPLLPKARPDWMIYSARKTDDYASQVVVHNLSSHEEKTVYRDPAPTTAVDVSADGQRALLIREAASGRELLELELDKGVARRLVPEEGKFAMVAAAAYSVDGKRAFVATDGGSESYSVLALDLSSLRKLAEYKQTAPATAAVRGVLPSPSGDRLAIRIDAGNRSFVRILEATKLTVIRDIGTPPGTTSLGIETELVIPLNQGTFSADGRHFLLTVSTPHAPHDLYLVDTRAGSVNPLRKEERPGFEDLPPVAASIERVPAFDGLSIAVNVYLPEARPNKLGTIVSLHGGPDQRSAFEWSAWTRIFASLGFAVLEPNIRGSTGFGRAFELADDKEKRVDALKDIESVNRWARQQAWCDPDRLTVMGGSFGGYYVLMALARQAALWSAGIDVAGVADLRLLAEQGAKRYLTELGNPETDKALLDELSPLRELDKIQAPLFVYQGVNDDRVPRVHPDAVVRKLRERDIPVEYMLAANEGHSVSRRENQVEFLTRCLRFLEDVNATGRHESARDASQP